MGKLADLAGTKKLKGNVQVTCMKTGASRVCKNEEEALALIGSASVEHRRGAFFYGGAAEAPVVVIEDKPADDEPAEKPKKTKKKSPRSKPMDADPLD